MKQNYKIDQKDFEEYRSRLKEYLEHESRKAREARELEMVKRVALVEKV